MGTNEKDSDGELVWEPVRVNHLVNDKWIDFREVDYRLPDGQIGPPYYNYSRKDYAVVVASDEEGKYICVKQFRHGIREVTTEFTAGGIETKMLAEYANTGKPDAYHEKALEAAKRELQEETGYASEEWMHILTVPSNATMADNYAFIYFAKNCRKISGQSLDDTEFVNVTLKTAEEIEALITEGEFQQAIHILAWELVKNRLR